MDPLSALSIAAAVVQFIQFGCSLVSKAHQFHDSATGALMEHIECEHATTRILELTERVHSSASKVTFGPEEKAIEAVCRACSDISNELVVRLHKLRLEPGTKERRWKSFRQALKTIWVKEDMDLVEKRLLTCQRELDSHLIANTWRHVNALKLSDGQVWASLDIGNQQIIDALLKSRDLSKEEIGRQTQISIDSNNLEHLKTRSLIYEMSKNKDADAVKIHLVESLQFMAMTERREEISAAHQKTFEWIFRDPAVGSKPWSNFVNWLEQGSGIYWINGKAGSGKSTLMRELVENPKTLQSIKVWSGGLPTKVVSFFFWNSGATLQRSQTGLFRSLLYEVLRDQRDLVPYVFPELLENALSDVKRGQNVLSMKWNWSLRTLQKGFARLVEFATTSLKFCFFLDGLDEYEGDHESLAEFFTSLSTSPHVKLCVSSRPQLVFEDCFKRNPSLRLQDLTFDDIAIYVSDKLQGHPKMSDLARENPTHATELVNEIVTKADGVFLWVILVVRSLLTGLRNGDSISNLHRRLKDLPAGLSQLYTHMMAQIEPLYRQQTSQIFQTFLAMMIVQGSYGNVHPIGLNLALTACPTNDFHPKWTPMETPMEETEHQSRLEQMDTYLKSCCAGLLEISGHIRLETCLLKVVFLHRTVKDFLETEDVHAVLLSDTALIPNFEPNVWALMSYITRLRRSVFLEGDGLFCYPETKEGQINYKFWLIGHFALLYAAKAAKSGNRTYEDMVDVLDRTIRRYWQGCIDGWEDGDHTITRDQLREWSAHLHPHRWRNSLLTKAITLGMHSYVEKKLRWDPTLSTKRPGLPLLDYALIPRRLDGEISSEMVEILLKYGANPNQIWGGTSTWQRALRWGHDHLWDRYGSTSPQSTLTRTSWAKILKVLLQDGANPLATCAGNHRVSCNPSQESHRVEDLINDVFESGLPQEACELRFLLQEQKKALDNSPASKSSLGYKNQNENRKRHYPRDEELNSRKRRQQPNPPRFYRTSDRHLHSATQERRYGPRSTWDFSK